MEEMVLQWFDLPGLYFIVHQLQCPFLDATMPVITHLGLGNLIGIGMAMVLLLFQRTRKIGGMLAIAFLLGFVCCNLTLKPLIGRIRPFDYVADVLHHPDIRTHLLVSAPCDGSFPSGHAVFAFIWASVLWQQAKRPWGYLACVIAVLIAFSRVYLFVHWPSDVIAGAGLGVLCGIIGVRVVNRIRTRVPTFGDTFKNDGQL